MIHEQDTRVASVIIPQSVGTTPVTGLIDTDGYHYAVIDFHLDTASASSVITTAALYEGTATNAVTTPVTAFVGGTAVAEGSVGYVLPVPNTSTPDMIRYCVDLRRRQRYLKVSFASTTARISAVQATLSRAKVAPTTDAQRGATTVIG